MASTIRMMGQTASSVSLELNNGDGANRTFTFELNRAADFASDESIFYSLVFAAGATTFTFGGLPNATTYHIRARNDLGGEVPAIVAATSDLALDTSYNGLNVDKAMLVVPADIRSISASGGGNLTFPAGAPVQNLLREEPAAVFRTEANTGAAITFQVPVTTSGEPIDTIALLGCFIPSDATWQILSSPDGSDPSFNGPNSFTTASVPMRISPTIGARRDYHALLRLAQPTRNRVWLIRVNVPNARAFIARHLVMGLARQSINANRGNGFAMNDFGSAARTRFGALDAVTGWVGRTIDFELGWLSEAEYHTKWSPLGQMVGRRKPVLVMPNSKLNVFANDQIGYGPITAARGVTTYGTRHSQTIEIDSVY